MRLILSADPELARVVSLSMWVSSVALIIATLAGLPAGSWLALATFRLRRVVVALLYTGMGLPPVAVGLFVYLMLSRSGPLGALGWLFTPWAMIAAQAVIAFPLVAGLTMTAVMGVDPALRQQVVSLGATRWQATATVLREARTGVVVAVVAAFGSIISEVGAVMLVGGNIAGSTRVLTTAIVLETRQGAFDLAIALGIILLALSFVANSVVIRLQGRAVA